MTRQLNDPQFIKDRQTRENVHTKEFLQGFWVTDNFDKPLGVFKLAAVVNQNLFHRVTALFIKSHKNRLVVNCKNNTLTFPLIEPVPYKYSPLEYCQLFLNEKLNFNSSRITRLEGIKADGLKNFAFISIYLACVDNIATMNIPVYQDSMHSESLKINPDLDLLLVDQDELAALQHYGMEFDTLFKKIYQKIFAD